MFRISWICNTTHNSGHGEYCFSQKNAEEFIAFMNAEYPDIIHWIEEEPITNAEEDPVIIDLTYMSD